MSDVYLITLLLSLILALSLALIVLVCMYSNMQREWGKANYEKECALLDLKSANGAAAHLKAELDKLEVRKEGLHKLLELKNQYETVIQEVRNMHQERNNHVAEIAHLNGQLHSKDEYEFILQNNRELRAKVEELKMEIPEE